MSAVVRCWGVRGSTPAASPDTRRYGGNTSCLTLTLPSGRTLVFDAGTGVRVLGEAMRARGVDDVSIFLTHAHWDHVQGLPFFAPLYRPGATVRIYAPESLAAHAERAVRAQMQPPVFPVTFDTLAARVEFHVLGDDGVVYDGVRVRPVAAHHGDHAVIWTVGPDNRAPWLVFAPDNEIGGDGGAALHGAWVDSFRGAALLVHDATYVPSESAAYAGWGHSAWDEAVELGLAAGVERVVLFHHHPSRGDAAIDGIVAEVRAFVEARGAAMGVVAASEGLVLRA